MAVPKVWPRQEEPEAASAPRVRRRARTVSPEVAPEARHVTVLIVRWALAAVCLGMLLTADRSSVDWMMGLAAVATLAASNLALARQDPEATLSIALCVAIALLDALLVVTAWFASGQESFVVVVISLGLLNLALAGLSITEIAAIALASLILYLIIGRVD